MKNINKLFAIAIVILGFSASSFAQDDATATATGTIITPISITKTVDMNFGNVAVTTTSGTVILTPAGTRSITGGVTLPAYSAGTVTAASFDVSGTPNYTYSITLPSSATTVTNTTGAGAETMSVNAFTSTPSGASSATGTLGSDGKQVVNVGATLNVASNQVAGTYVSSTPFTVTVNYN